MKHLLALSVGPVQEFIAAARRTRDLWFGSQLLSEISKAIARAVRDAGGKLIFPHPEADLAENQPFNVANVILAEVELPDSEAVRAFANQMRDVAQKRWKAFADRAFDEASGAIRSNVWDQQVNDVLEFYAAWVKYEDGKYAAARERVMRLLAGRKACRDFVPAQGVAGLPKSSLDGQRETVFLERKDWPKRFRAKLRVREGEQLDVVGLVKRVWKQKGKSNPRYPSVSRVAADPWVRGNRDKLGEVKQICETLTDPEGDLVIRDLDVSSTGHPHYADFRFEGTAIYRTRHHELIDEAEITEADLLPLRKALAKLPEPNPYLAVLVADGDKIGEALSQLQQAAEHRKFSKTLSKFAEEAKRIVEHEFHGVLVYSGGDDVVAFVPADTAIACARKLATTFRELLAEWSQKTGKQLTLSVGVAIGHFLENLEDLRQYGRDAEKAAKNPDRNGFAVHLHKRGGSPIKVRGQWNGNLDKRLEEYAQQFLNGAIPSRLSYDLKRLADVYRDWPPATVAAAIRCDVLRVIRDKQAKAGRKYLDELEGVLAERVSNANDLLAFAEELLVARQIAVALKQVGGK